MKGLTFLNKFPECSTKINLITNLPFLVEPRAILHSCRKDIDETIAAVRNHYSLLSTSVAVLDWWNKWYAIYEDSLPTTNNNEENNNNNSNSGWDFIKNVYRSSGKLIYNVPLRSIIASQQEQLQPLWMIRWDGFVDQQISNPSEFVFPTNLIMKTMDSVANQFNPYPPPPRKDVVTNSDCSKRKDLFRSSSLDYYNNLKKLTIKTMKEKILNHRCSPYGDSITISG